MNLNGKKAIWELVLLGCVICIVILGLRGGDYAYKKHTGTKKIEVLIEQDKVKMDNYSTKIRYLKKKLEGIMEIDTIEGFIQRQEKMTGKKLSREEKAIIMESNRDQFRRYERNKETQARNLINDISILEQYRSKTMVSLNQKITQHNLLSSGKKEYMLYTIKDGELCYE